jgi:histone acetyltransferase MYST2
VSVGLVSITIPLHVFFSSLAFPGLKRAADQDESPPRTPTGNALSSESDIDVSSPNVSHDESLAKELSLKDTGSDLSHRPKRRRFHESYNFNMKCPTPGCNSLGK